MANKIRKTDGIISFSDSIGSFKRRWGIDRGGYRVTPGIYALNAPNKNSPVFVSANYKMSFDVLRSSVKALDAWILVLDTKGVNVWCAAGEGTFGTNELIKRIRKTGLSRIVSHRKLIVPQLSASGVAAHKVKSATGFAVKFGPVRAADIPNYLRNGEIASERMRTVKFGFIDRMVLVPIELVHAWPFYLGAATLAMIPGLFFLSAGTGIELLILSLLSILTGTIIVPALLPFLPGRSFAFKGWFAGVIITAMTFVVGGDYDRLSVPGVLLLFPAVSAFLALNFTGCTTYTSHSGVKKEMRFALPAIIILAISGLSAVLWTIYQMRKICDI